MPVSDKNMSGDFSKNALSQLLARPENKTCADCMGKGPRWASWNLGVVLCIRCSGIHRSLGVHISRVKSVTLDTWTEEQLTCICSRGNGWAKEIYEAKLPEDFQRPNRDVDLEHFIREKYEKRKYCSSVDIPLRSLKDFAAFAGKDKDNLVSKKKDVNGNISDEKRLSGSVVPRPKATANRSAVQNQSSKAAITQQQTPIVAVTQQQQVPKSNLDDLLGLNTPTPALTQAHLSSSGNDFFSSAPQLPPQQQQQSFSQTQQSSFPYNASQVPGQQQQAHTAQQQQTHTAQQQQAQISQQQAQIAQQQAQIAQQQQAHTAQQQALSQALNSQLLSKDKILSLYSRTNQPAMQQNPYMMAGNFQPKQPMAGGYGGYPQQQVQRMPPSNMVYQTMPQGMPSGYQQPHNMQAMQQMQWQQQQQQLQMQMQGMRIQQNNLQTPFSMQQNASAVPNMHSHATYAAPNARGNALSQPSYNSWHVSPSHPGNNQSLSSDLWK